MIYKHDAIFVQIDYHSWIGKFGDVYMVHYCQKKIKKDYEILYEYLFQYTPNI